jgi:rubrerythrin
MELGAIFLLLLVLAIIVLFVSKPFSENWRIQAQSSHELSSLLAERERALNALQELDFDYGLGKVPQDEYSVQRANLLRNGADVLRRLDEIQGVETMQAEEPDKQTFAKSHTSFLSDEDLEELIAKRRGNRRQKTAGFCPRCGKPILRSDQFCPTCGQRVSSE